MAMTDQTNKTANNKVKLSYFYARQDGLNSLNSLFILRYYVVRIEIFSSRKHKALILALRLNINISSNPKVNECYQLQQQRNVYSFLTRAIKLVTKGKRVIYAGYNNLHSTFIFVCLFSAYF